MKTKHNEAHIEESEPVTDAYAEWDDPNAFRVYLVRDDDTAKPMKAHYRDDGTVEARLYRAAFLKCPKDFINTEISVGAVGWPTAASAKRVAKAVNAELKRIAKGEPGPTDADISFAAQIARIMKPKKKART